MSTRTAHVLAATVASAALYAGCNKQAYTWYELPEPGPSIPYGLISVQLEVGDSRQVRLEVEGAGRFARYARVHADGLVTVKAMPGTWRVAVTGVSPEPAVVGFDGAVKAGAGTAGKRSWPEKPFEVRVAKNKLTWIGKICAHRGCKAVWSPANHPVVDDWADERRLELFSPPEPPPASAAEPGSKTGAGEAAPERPDGGQPKEGKKEEDPAAPGRRAPEGSR